MSVVWTLEYDGDTRTLADWGLSGLQRRLVNQDVDTVTFRQDGAAFDGTPLFAYGQTVKIFRDAVKWFEGRVDRVPRFGTPAAEGLQYVVVGPWWYLEKLVYQQGWNVRAGEGVTVLNKSRILLNVALDGTKLTTGQVIEDVLEFVRDAAGLPLAFDATHFPAVNAHVNEGLDLVCAEVIRQMLRWSPDSVTWFDYSTTPPTLHCARRADLGTVGLPITALASLDIDSREDLQVPAVVLKFEQTNLVNGTPYLQVTEQKAPSESATGLEPNALVATILLEGFVRNEVTATIETEAIDETSLAWWRAHVPKLADSRYVVIDAPTETNREFPHLPRELVTGQIAPWMNKETRREKITARIHFRAYSTAVPGEQDESTTVFEDNEKFTVEIVSTTATSGAYRAEESFTPGEAVPAGLAQVLYDALNPLVFDGKLSIVEQDCSGALAMGATLNLTGGAAAWAGMNAMVQEITEDVEAGTTSASFGPAKHLGVDDLIELLRVNRQRQVFTNPLTRQTGEAYGSGRVELGENTALSNTTGGTLQPQRIKLGRRGVPTAGEIDLNFNDATSSGAPLVAKLRWTKVCDNGVDAWCKVLRTAAQLQAPTPEELES